MPWGTGEAEFEKMLRELHRLGIRPTLIGLEYSHKFEDNMAEMAKCVEFMNPLEVSP